MLCIPISQIGTVYIITMSCCVNFPEAVGKSTADGDAIAGTGAAVGDRAVTLHR